MYFLKVTVSWKTHESSFTKKEQDNQNTWVHSAPNWYKNLLLQMYNLEIKITLILYGRTTFCFIFYHKKGWTSNQWNTESTASYCLKLYARCLMRNMPIIDQNVPKWTLDKNRVGDGNGEEWTVCELLNRLIIKAKYRRENVSESSRQRMCDKWKHKAKSCVENMTQYNQNNKYKHAFSKQSKWDKEKNKFLRQCEFNRIQFWRSVAQKSVDVNHKKQMCTKI